MYTACATYCNRYLGMTVSGEASNVPELCYILGGLSVLYGQFRAVTPSSV